MKETIENEKVTDMTLSRSITVSVIGIVLCLACLFGTTWAWYSLSITSGENELTSANFDFTLEADTIVSNALANAVNNDAVNDENGEKLVKKKLVKSVVKAIVDDGSSDFEVNDDGEYVIPEGEYVITLTKTGTATKGWCQIIGKSEYSTAGTPYYLEFDEDVAVAEFNVIGPGTLKITPMWGEPSGNKIPENGINLTTSEPTLLDALLSMMTDQGDTEDPTESAEVTGQTEPEAPAEQPTETPTEPEAPTEQPAETTTQ